jgi:N6-L-threonylcarbamoyladenine synthase
MRKAQALAEQSNKPFVAVHHLEAHCLMARLAGNVITSDDSTHVERNECSSSLPFLNNEVERLLHFTPRVRFPFLVLLASGGHTSFLVCHSLGEYSLLGGTLDDSLGEAFDKAARLLGLDTSDCSGGVALEKAATRGDPAKYSFMKQPPMQRVPSCDLSYSGLKNAFRMALERLRKTVDPFGEPAVSQEPLRTTEPIMASESTVSCHRKFVKVLK